MAAPDSHFVVLQLMNLIDSGAQGKVYKAKRTDTDVIIAVKYVNLDLESSNRENQLVALRSKFEDIKNLDHPNVVRHIHTQTNVVVSLYEQPTYQIIMEYCEGKTLHNLVKDFTVTPLLLQKWTRQLVDAITYLHEQCCVHRDIKGANILTTSLDANTCDLKIADLGDIKRLMKEATQTKEVSHEKGTWAFMSPEMIKGEQTENEQCADRIKLGRRTDIWSLGCVIIEMLNGALPQFHNKNGILVAGDMAVMYFIGSGGSPTVPAKLPQKVHDFITKCLKRNPNERPFAAALKQHEFLTSAPEDVATWILPPRLK
ncbi:uncharacterized protein LOC129585148 [Paramacrobiotus metropolitanus]|uniref:uncharacterized protein LOC129585148 n=1 Tax=Paramacrobiotus metropolitanus TaxID=2943436 RepID=UPI002445D974|nr:uncharacterized protein LOC129585148 [Paramacrobiotus metropolitanus]